MNLVQSGSDKIASGINTQPHMHQHEPTAGLFTTTKKGEAQITTHTQGVTSFSALDAITLPYPYGTNSFSLLY